MDGRVNSAPRTGIQFARKKQILIFQILIFGEERFKKLMERVKYEWEHFEE
jgi:hypothetical protein